MRQDRDDRRPRPEDQPLFEFGSCVATPGALETLARLGLDPLTYLSRHGKGDWGDLDEEDRRSNEVALNRGGRLVSAYDLPENERLWIITEWDRSYTTLLLPSEY